MNTKRKNPAMGLVEILFTAIFVIFYFSLLSFSQEQNQKVKIFYPLNTGDYWEYHLSTPLLKEYKKVIGDTLMPNGKAYKIIYECWIHGYCSKRFQRVEDSLALYQYVHPDSILSEEKVYNLYVAVGDTWRYPKNGIGGRFAFFKVNAIEKKIVLGRPLNVVHIVYIIPFDWGELAESEFSIADSLGIIWEGFEEGTATLIGAIINGVKYGETSVNERTRENFEDFISLESYPNPFNSQTTIFYTIPKPQDIDISIFNVYGRKVVCLINDKKQEGCHRILWSGVDGEGKVLPSGIYLCRLMGENISLTRKICIVR